MHTLIFFVFILANANAEEHHDLNHRNTSIVDRSTGVRLPLVRMKRADARRPADLRMDVHNGHVGAYFLTLGVGTPPTNQTLLMDTGSDLTWIQCQQCITCFHQPHPIFDPRNSSSLTWVPCDSNSCNDLQARKYGCFDNQCVFNYSYADGSSYILGSLAYETLTLGETTVPNMVMGCANENYLSLDNNGDGLLGLGWGSLSVVNRSSAILGEAFSFCLSGDEGWLTFGRPNFPRTFEWVPLIRNPKFPSLYYVDLLRLEVDGAKVENIPEDAFRIDPNSGEGGVIIDTGTTLTYLLEPAYNALRDSVRARLDKLFNSTEPFDVVCGTCYRLGSRRVGSGEVQFPRISFIFREKYSVSLEVQLNMYTTKVPVTLVNITCFAFARTNVMISVIIGNMQMQGTKISIDASSGFVGFGPSNAC